MKVVSAFFIGMTLTVLVGFIIATIFKFVLGYGLDITTIIMAASLGLSVTIGGFAAWLTAINNTDKTEESK